MEDKEKTTIFYYIFVIKNCCVYNTFRNTLIVLLSRLVGKGYLKATKTGRRNEYTPLISETEYQTSQTQNFIDKVYEGSVKGLVMNLIAGDLLTDEEYEELKRLLEGGNRS